MTRQVLKAENLALDTFKLFVKNTSLPKWMLAKLLEGGVQSPYYSVTTPIHHMKRLAAATSKLYFVRNGRNRRGDRRIYLR